MLSTPAIVHVRRKLANCSFDFVLTATALTTPKGEFNLLALNQDIADGIDADHWHEVLNQLATGEMPPEDAEQLSDKERQQLVNWIRSRTRHRR